MDTQSTNPLAGFFRQPAIHLKLPSGGQYWDEKDLSLPVTGEIPVYPMTTKDEITLRTPDALLNGAGIVSVIQSCCPNILNPWNMPSIDVDSVLIAIRIASYSNKMELESKCPHCNEENTYEVDLNEVLARIRAPDYKNLVEVHNLKIKLHPQKYFSVNKTSMINFEEQKVLQTINDESLSDEVRTVRFAESMRRLLAINMQVIVDSTESITTPDGRIVTDTVFISEFYENADRSIVTAIRDWLEKAAELSAVKPVNVVCADCQKPFELSVTFDYASFFA